jgi:hypothetical protein
MASQYDATKFDSAVAVADGEGESSGMVSVANIVDESRKGRRMWA